MPRLWAIREYFDDDKPEDESTEDEHEWSDQKVQELCDMFGMAGGQVVKVRNG